MKKSVLGFFGKNDPYDFFIDTRVDGTWYSAFSTNNISASGGRLILDASGFQEISFTEGDVTTSHNAYIGEEVQGRFYTYGYAEIYVKLDVCSGVCPAFWLLGNDGKFHKYAVEWTEDFIYFLYDDERVMRMQLQEGEFSGAMCPILTIYSGVDVTDGIYHTGSPEDVTDEEWNNSSSFEIEYMKIYSKQFQK